MFNKVVIDFQLMCNILAGLIVSSLILPQESVQGANIDKKNALIEDA